MPIPFAFLLSLSLAATPQVPAKAAAPPPKPVTVDLAVDPQALNLEADQRLGVPFYPSSVKLVDEKPLGVVKEPAYRGKPQYGAIRLGNGPRSTIYFAVDEVKGEAGRIYIDANANGDLTDDGSPEWDRTDDDHGVPSYLRSVVLRASWGDAVSETGAAGYGLLVYKRQGDPQLNYTRISGRVGSARIGGKTVKLLLAENQSDAVYTVPRKGDATRRPVWLILDPGAGQRSIRADLSEPFQVGGQWYEAFPTVSGDQITIQAALKPGEAPAPRGPAVALRRVGQTAPDFVAQSPSGKPLHLSDFRGKIVLLDFWATWCGPCQASMPGLEKIYRQVKRNGVVVLSVNVFDAKDPFDAWIAKNSGTTYSFTFAFDPAGRDQEKSIAASKYGVTGIPTLFVIDKKGRIANVIIGSGNEKNIADALTKLGAPATFAQAQ